MSEFMQCTPRETRRAVIDCLRADLVPFVESSPGCGKSAIMRSISDDFGLQMIDHRLSTSAPEDLSGLPRFDEDGKARFSPFADLFPLESQEVPDEKDGWLLFLDEANSASKAVQAASYKLVLDRAVGQHKLHNRCKIAMAGNLATDRAIVNPLSTAMQSRVVHIEMKIDFNEWLEDVAINEGYDSRIIAYLSYRQGHLFDFKPDHNDKTFACPRTWEFMNRLVKGNSTDNDRIKLFAGTISGYIATEFVQFCKVYHNMVRIEQILEDPYGCPVPQDVSTKWAVITHMTENLNNETIEKISTYADRFDMAMRVLYYRMMMLRHPEWRTHPVFQKAVQTVTAYLNS